MHNHTQMLLVLVAVFLRAPDQEDTRLEIKRMPKPSASIY